MTRGALMIPMSVPDKKTAIAAAFASRFAIGFLIGVTRMPIPGWAQGAIVGLLISIRDVIVTKAYAPILATELTSGFRGIPAWERASTARGHGLSSRPS